MEEYHSKLCIDGVTLDVQTGRPVLLNRSFAGTGEPDAEISLTAAELARLSRFFPDDFTEEQKVRTILSVKAGGALLRFGRCLFHGTAFLWRGRAWIFTAPSGTGKTTQYVRWKMRYGAEVSILNGDKPVLRMEADGGITVCPSPWRGKENLGREESAPLGGLILLAQGKENSIRLLEPREAFLPIYRQILALPEDAEGAARLCETAERLISAVPVFYLTNLGDEASAELTHDFILTWERQKNAEADV